MTCGPIFFAGAYQPNIAAVGAQHSIRHTELFAVNLRLAASGLISLCRVVMDSPYQPIPRTIATLRCSPSNPPFAALQKS